MDELGELPLIVLGTARLPRAVVGEHAEPLLVELVLDRRQRCIRDVATNVSLPGYTDLLRRLLIGHRVDEVERLSYSLCERYRGPLLRPTVAALANAVANSKDAAAADDA